jgi:hypothetical protein
MRFRLLLILIPILIFAHIKDERLFKTPDVPASALILLDRSGSMDTPTLHADKCVMINDYSFWDRRTSLNGWYDTDYAPDGPGDMGSFVGDDAKGNWIIRISCLNACGTVNNWKLKIKISGVWHEYDGGSFDYGECDWWSGATYDWISIPDFGTVDDVELYLNIACGGWWYRSWGRWRYYQSDIGDIRIILGRPGFGIYWSTRIKDAINVVHSLLDADNDGFVTNADEQYLPVEIGQGFHRENKDPDVYLPMSSYYDSDLGESYNENTKEWDNVGDGWMKTDSIGSHFEDIWNHFNYTDVGGSTPNGVLIADAKDYINNWRSAHPDLWCMSHNLILVTDGQTNTPKEECSDGSRDVVRQAWKAWHQDSIKVYAVGFGTEITEAGANELNWVAYHGGTQWMDSIFIDSMINNHGMDTTAVDASSCSMSDPQNNFLTGYAYITENAWDLSRAISEIFMKIAGQRSVSYAAGEVTSVEEELLSMNFQSRLYFASFIPDTQPVWDGDLTCVKLQPGELDLDSLPPEIIIWSAGDSLLVDKTAEGRSIYGIKSNGSMLPFNASNFDSSDLDVPSTAIRDMVIERVRDGLIDDNKGELGDIFHSAPLRVHVPNYFYIDQGYYEYYGKMKDRSPLLYAGGNDGMLHVFADSVIGVSGRGGEEIAGIIPMNFVPLVKQLLYQHDYFVDTDPVAADVWFPQNSDDSVKEWSEWHTVLIACQGEGGRSFTGLDITDPLNETSHPMSSIQFLFDATESNLFQDTLGYTTSIPMIHKVGVNWAGHSGRTIDRFYAFMGGGQWPDPMDASLLDSIFSGGEVEGNVIIAFDIWNVVDNGINGNVYLVPPISRDVALADAPFPASAAVVNINPEVGHRYDLLFIPDAFGQLWFVDLRNPDPSNWEAECIFHPELPASSDSSELVKWHPACYRPLVWKDPIYKDYWVIYGTGNRSDIFCPSLERFYCLKYPESVIEDTSAAIPVYSEGDLGEPGIPSGSGWMLTLAHSNEKVVTPGVFYQDSVKFFTFTPGEVALSTCEIGGSGSVARSYIFDIRTGGTAYIGGTVEETGMPQPPNYSYSLGGTGMEINQVAGKIKVMQKKGFKSFKEIIKWKEE